MSDYSSGNRLLVLDSLRGMAAIMVVMFHYTMHDEKHNFLFKLGTAGVDLFFIISGFVIFMSLSKVSSIWEFIIHRITRLYPTYWASVSFTMVFILIYCLKEPELLNLDFLNRYLWNLSMFQFYADVPDLDGPYWTMIIEMIFYALMICFYSLRILKFSVYFGLISAAFFSLALYFYPDKIFFTQLLTNVPFFQFASLFFAGICFYKIYNKKGNLILNYSFSIFFLANQILIFRYAGRSSDHISHFQYAGMLIAFFVIFILFVNNKLNFIATKSSIFIGKISFALYLIHQFFGVKFLIPILVDDYKINFWVASVLITLPITILVATAITFFIEIPVNRFVRARFFKKNKFTFGFSC